MKRRLTNPVPTFSDLTPTQRRHDWRPKKQKELDSPALGHNPVTTSCEHGNEPWGSQRARTFLSNWATASFTMRALLHGVRDFIRVTVTGQEHNLQYLRLNGDSVMSEPAFRSVLTNTPPPLQSHGNATSNDTRRTFNSKILKSKK
jgi:hypothetical protein